MAAIRVPIVDLTPIAKKRVRPREPKYASENGSLSVERICLRSNLVY